MVVTDTAFYTLTEPNMLEIPYTKAINVACKGEETGQILIAANGGTAIPGIPTNV